MPSISYTKFQFKRPAEYGEFEYRRMKELLIDDPNYKLGNQPEWTTEFTVRLIIMIAGILAFLFSKVVSESLVNWFNFITILSLIPTSSFVLTLSSYLRYNSASSKYYDKLKNDIMKTNDYVDFLALRRKRGFIRNDKINNDILQTNNYVDFLASKRKRGIIKK
jgi:hypothetical protein